MGLLFVSEVSDIHECLVGLCGVQSAILLETTTRLVDHYRP